MQRLSEPGQRCFKLFADTKLLLAETESDDCTKLASAINGGSEKLGAKTVPLENLKLCLSGWELYFLS